jgi:hypothetical protein
MEPNAAPKNIPVFVAMVGGLVLGAIGLLSGSAVFAVGMSSARHLRREEALGGAPAWGPVSTRQVTHAEGIGTARV